MPNRPELLIVPTELGTFFEVNREGPLTESWTFECPACHKQRYLDIDQWEGRVSAMCDCGNYHHTANYKRELLFGMKRLNTKELD